MHKVSDGCREGACKWQFPCGATTGIWAPVKMSDMHVFPERGLVVSMVWLSL